MPRPPALPRAFLRPLFAVALAAAFSATPARSATVPGPALDTQVTGPAALQPVGRPQPGGSETLARQTTDAQLVAPVPAAVLGGLLVAQVNVADERRTVAGAGAPSDVPPDEAHPAALGAGFLFLPHLAEGAPKLFFGASRYGHLRLQGDQKPMADFVAGADLLGPDLPFRLALSDTDQTVSRLAVEYRQFPGFHRWTLYAGHSIDRANGSFLAADIPDHVLLGWHDRDDVWRYYGGVRWTQRAYPFADGPAQTGWMEGYEQTLLVGLRRAVRRPLFIALEAGVEKEWRRFVDERGRELLTYATRYAPWGRLALETWIKNP